MHRPLALISLLLLAANSPAQEASPDPRIQAVFDALEAEDIPALRRAVGKYSVYAIPPDAVREAVAEAVTARYGTPEAPRPIEGTDPVEAAIEAASLARDASATQVRLAWEAHLFRLFTEAPGKHAARATDLRRMGSPDDTLDHARRRFEALAALLPHQGEARPDRQLGAWYGAREDYVQEDLLPRGAREEIARVLEQVAVHFEKTRDALPEDVARDRMFSTLQRRTRAAADLAEKAVLPRAAARFWDLFEDLLRREEPERVASPDWLTLERIRTVSIPQQNWDEARAILREHLAAGDPEGRGGALTERLLLLEIALASGATEEAEALKKDILRGEAREPEETARRGLLLLWAGAPGVLVSPGDRVVPAADHPIALALPPGSDGLGLTLTFPHRELEYPRDRDDHITRWQYEVPVVVHDPAYAPDQEAPLWTEVRFDRAAWNQCLDRWDARPSRAWSYEDYPVQWQAIACKASMDWSRWEREAPVQKK